ncbi:MAG: cell division protein ZapA [Succinivibrio sp.]|nr:cell division protein ZapA [Succinivibrio sp.]
MPKQNANEIENISFSVFGESFTLRCRKDHKENLLAAISSIQSKTSKLLRDNPTLSPQQTAILTAIEIQSALQNYMHSNTPFESLAFESVRQTRLLLESALNNAKR